MAAGAQYDGVFSLGQVQASCVQPVQLAEFPPPFESVPNVWSSSQTADTEALLPLEPETEPGRWQFLLDKAAQAHNSTAWWTAHEVPRLAPQASHLNVQAQEFIPKEAVQFPSNFPSANLDGDQDV